MFKLELKRIFSKKLNVLAVGLMVILAAVFSGFAATSNRYVDAHGAVSTGMLATRKLAENKQEYAGALTEAELTKIVVQYKAVMAQSQEEQDANYGTLYQPIDDILNFMISVLTPDAGYDETVLDSVTEDSVQDFYTWYRGNMKWMADQYGKTPEQKDYLEKKYGTIDNLNQRWGLELFSQAYDSFEQVPMPKPYVWHGAHIKYEWLLYQAQAHIDFIKMQAQILHRYTDVPVGTDMMPILEMDYEKIAECTDIMQFNHYHDESNLWEAAFWFDYLRTFKEIPFWNTETSTCWNGGLYTPSNLRPEGFCRANSWLPLLLGGSVNMYWLWRQHRTGHELMHGSVLYASGRTMHIFGEVQETAAQIKKAADFLETTKVVTGTAMVVTTKNAGMMRCQPVTSVEEETGDRRLNFYRCLMNAGLRPDIISAGKDLDSYKLLFTPYVLTLEERNLAEKIEKWVRDGGVWVAGPMTDIRDSIGAHYTDSETGMLERLTGSQLVQQIPDHRHHIRCEWQDGTEFKACNFLQLFEIPEDAEALAAVKSGFSTLVGQKVLFSKKVGKGLVIVLGTMPGPEDMEKVLKLAIEESGVSHFEFTGDIVAAVRSSIPLKTAQKDSGSYDRIPPCSETEQGSMVTKRGIVTQAGITGQEISGRTGTLKIDGTMTDLLTDRVYTDVVPFEPYQTVVLV